MSSGSNAVSNGKQFAKFIEGILKSKNYNFIVKKKFIPTISLGQPIYSKEFQLCKSIYNADYRCDFIIFNPILHPSCLVIESKWQQKAGSVDEKFPYLSMNIKQQFPYNAIIVVGGSGFKPGAIQWIRNQVGGKLINVFDMAQFLTWSNNNNI